MFALRMMRSTKVWPLSTGVMPLILQAELSTDALAARDPVGLVEGYNVMPFTHGDQLHHESMVGMSSKVFGVRRRPLPDGSQITGCPVKHSNHASFWKKEPGKGHGIACVIYSIREKFLAAVLQLARPKLRFPIEVLGEILP
ncbi:hypothetical protein H257_15490 [Aphanomyces astaci]|uniref:Uncharacterized protein n=1 Tax=Aphanomyces astaci TaxID=112090 RepID=W4FP29_APHAT|nr:hypothetical protein H257_15490 [Aphanomyces astaci]ETV68691.1 hypothetical protein H257_15490 [Aphanomyces astaci]|eukprot:XP_009841916.1 hypothetical protein H257_15490 [Aphanomyces astaci]